MSRTEYALLITIVSDDRLVRDKCCYGILPITSDVGAAWWTVRHVMGPCWPVFPMSGRYCYYYYRVLRAPTGTEYGVG